MPLPPNLCYTIAIDKPGEDVHRRMARLLVTSLIRTGWHGKIVVFHNNPVPVMPEGHPDVEERMIEQEASVGFAGITRWKYRVRNRLDVSGFGKVLFLDCDIIALRDVNHLMLGTWDIYTAPEPGRIVELPFNGYLTDDEFVVLADRPGINSGTIGLRAAAFHQVMADWEKIDDLPAIRRNEKTQDQHSWNRLLLDTALRQRTFAPGEIQFPFLHRAVWPDYRRAALVHLAGRTPQEKLKHMYGLWAENFATDVFEEVTAPKRKTPETRAHQDCDEPPD